MDMKRIFAIAAAAVALAASLSSCVQDKVYGLPTITDINNTVAVSASDEVVVTATVASLTGISYVNLLWAADGGSWTTVEMQAAGDSWSGVIPAQPLDTEVSYYIEAASEGGETAVSATVSYVVGAAVIDYSGLRLNELNGNDKFIEIYNASGEDIPLSGICIFNLSLSVCRVLRKRATAQLSFSIDYASHDGANGDGSSLSSFPFFLRRYLSETGKDPFQPLEFTFSSLYPFRHSQASFGGIDPSLFDEDFTLRSDPTFHALGEVLDVNFPCGGYNIGFALIGAYRLSERLRR